MLTGFQFNFIISAVKSQLSFTYFGASRLDQIQYPSTGIFCCSNRFIFSALNPQLTNIFTLLNQFSSNFFLTSFTSSGHTQVIQSFLNTISD
ncbi:MAG: hypothetical protein ACOZBL_04425 [Patescibacteria group bacterium]